MLAKKISTPPSHPNMVTSGPKSKKQNKKTPKRTKQNEKQKTSKRTRCLYNGTSKTNEWHHRCYIHLLIQSMCTAIYIFVFKKNQMLILITLQPHSYCSEYFKYLIKRRLASLCGLDLTDLIDKLEKKMKVQILFYDVLWCFFPVCVPPTLFKCFVVPWHDNERLITWCGVTLPRKKLKIKKESRERYWIEWEFNLTAVKKLQLVPLN